MDPPFSEVRQVLRGHHEVVVVVQDHESADGRASTDQQIDAGQLIHHHHTDGEGALAARTRQPMLRPAQYAGIDFIHGVLYVSAILRESAFHVSLC